MPYPYVLPQQIVLLYHLLPPRVLLRNLMYLHFLLSIPPFFPGVLPPDLPPALLLLASFFSGNARLIGGGGFFKCRGYHGGSFFPGDGFGGGGGFDGGFFPDLGFGSRFCVSFHGSEL
ncbi:hypothetical protein VNO78_21641 [Psophocarpus tetragonolobus]|uniref:Uncharacterized protein n=1 Tax=Psophocarpus tetragonolobus TaxID=3891 RepID=A0AAN9XIA2_PSOTE